MNTSSNPAQPLNENAVTSEVGQGGHYRSELQGLFKHASDGRK